MTETAADGVRLESVAFRYGATPVVRGLSFTVPAGQLLTLIGPSGCGKTTLLRLIGGYLEPGEGRVFLRGREVTALPPERRNAGMVFQNYALFPHLTARQNVAFGLETRRVPRGECSRRVEAMFDRVGLTHAERDRKPAALSGGQQQRVALARALVIEPDVLLLDEPLANLDRHLRDQLRAELRHLQRQTGVTTILVTHDQDEALAVSDRLAVMSAGTILQIGSPAELYERPRTPFVARFLGIANLLDGKHLGHPAPLVLVRPEHCILNPGIAGPLVWHGRIVSASYLGPDFLADVVCDNGVSLKVRNRSAGPLPAGRVTVGIPAEQLWPIPEPGAI